MYTLHIDETGTNTLKHIEKDKPHFIMSSVILHKKAGEPLRTKANQIKFKYWGRYKMINLHAQEMKSLRGIYSIFREKNGKKPKLSIEEFYEDIINMLNESSIKVGAFCINKDKYINKNRSLSVSIKKMDEKRKNKYSRYVSGIEKKIIQNFAYNSFVMFLSSLDKNKRGQIVIESSTKNKDILFFDAYSKLMQSGCPELGLNNLEVREKLSSISFVTKNNEDIETQIADLVAHFFGIKSRIIDNIEIIDDKSVESKMLKKIESLTFEYKSNCNPNKKVDSFQKINSI